MVIRVYLQNPRSGFLLFMHLQEGNALRRRPLEMKYTYPSNLSHVVSEYIWLCGSISKILGGVCEQTNKQTNKQTDRQTEATTL